MRKRLTTMLAALAALVLCVSLAACGPTGPTEADFVGTWDLNEIQSDDSDYSMSESDIESLADYGLEIYLNLDDNGDAALVVYDSALEGDWELGSDGITITFDGTDYTGALSDDKLTLTQNDVTLVFVKGDDKDTPSSTSSGSSLVDGFGSDSSSSSSSSDVETDVEEDIDDVTIVDDDSVTIVVTAVGTDWTGDPGYYMTITNKTDRSIYVYASYSTFSVDGKMVDPSLSETITSGSYAEGFMYFDSDDVASYEDLTNVKGTLIVTDDDTYETIEEVPFAM